MFCLAVKCVCLQHLGDDEIDNNFYWLSDKKDILDYENDGIKYCVPMTQSADYTALNSLQNIKLDYDINRSEDSDYAIFTIDIKNDSDVLAFFVELKNVDKNDGLTILPVLWSDNYISILPGETRKYTAKIRKEYLKKKAPVFQFSGWNVAMNEIEKD